jgi:hypothetical protein
MKKGTDEEFYQRATGVLLDSSPPRHPFFASKTPTLLLPAELYTEARRLYRDTIVVGAKGGRFRPTYCFARAPTIEGLIPLFDKNKDRRKRWWHHIADVCELIKLGIVDLRASPNVTFTSGIVTEKPDEAMIHVKYPHTLQTREVRFYEGIEARQHVTRLTKEIRRLPSVNLRAFAEILLEVRSACWQINFVKPLRNRMAEELERLASLITGMLAGLAGLNPGGKAEIMELARKHSATLRPSWREKNAEDLVKLFEEYDTPPITVSQLLGKPEDVSLHFVPVGSPESQKKAATECAGFSTPAEDPTPGGASTLQQEPSSKLPTRVQNVHEQLQDFLKKNPRFEKGGKSLREIHAFMVKCRMDAHNFETFARYVRLARQARTLQRPPS